MHRFSLELSNANDNESFYSSINGCFMEVMIRTIFVAWLMQH